MSDLFAATTTIADRLTAQVTGATVYRGSQIVGANSQAASLPALIVAPGEATPIDASISDERGGSTVERVTWRVGVRAASNTGAAVSALAEHVIGALCYSVIQALVGYPITSSSGRTRLRYTGRDEMMYEFQAGYCEVWLNFSADTAIV